MPAIISKGDFVMAQEARPTRDRDSEDWGEFPLTGKGVCGCCGMNLVGTSGHGRHGKKYLYYKCSKGCGLKPVRADWLEPAVVSAVRDLLSNREEALRVARIVEARTKAGDSSKKVAAARKRATEAKAGIDRMMDAIASGLDPKLAQDKIAELQTTMEVAEAEVSVQENASRFSAEDFADFLQFGATLDESAILKAFVWQVRVDADSVEVVLNYDVKKSEPQRVVIPREGSDSFFLVGQVQNTSKQLIELGLSDGLILLRFPRAA